MSNRAVVIIFAVLFVVGFATVGQAVYHPATYLPTGGDFIAPFLLSALVALIFTGLVAGRASTRRPELMGVYRQMADHVRAEARNAGDRKLHWEVVVGQDDPPDGLWGWMIIQAHVWPADVINRVPVAFTTREEAREAGEREADALWVETNRQLAKG